MAYVNVDNKTNEPVPIEIVDDGGFLGNATKIRDVTIDTTVSSPSDGDILVYRDAGSDWVLEAKPAGGSNPSLSDITDVTLTSVTDEEILSYDSASGDWINRTASELGLGGLTFSTGLTDTSGTITVNESEIDHDQLLNYTPDEHFTQASISITASQVSDFDTEVSNNTDVSANTTHRSSDGTDHTYIDQDVTTTASPNFDGLEIDGATVFNDLITNPIRFNRIFSTNESLSLQVNDNHAEFRLSQDLDGNSDHFIIFDVDSSSSGLAGTKFEANGSTLLVLSENEAFNYKPWDFGGENITNIGTVDGRDLSVDGTKLDTIETSAEVNNISDANATDLTDGGNSTLHYHSADRNRSNHTGTQTASTISDFDTEVSNNTNVSANTTHRTSNGSDHSYINQDVTTSGTPTFASATINGDISGETKCWDFTIINPNGVYDKDTQVFVAVAKSALTITKLQVSLDSSSYNVAGDLKYADAFIGFANATVINDFDTTSGVRTDTSITSGSVASGKVIYLDFDSQPDSNITQMHVHIEWDYD